MVHGNENIDRKAIVWAANPDPAIYDEVNRYVGSLDAHMAHLKQVGAVYWSLLPPQRIRTEQFEIPMSGYIYSTESGMVDYRVRIIDISYDYDRKKKKCIPSFRSSKNREDVLMLLIDQIDLMTPSRELKEFIKKTDGTPIAGPMSGNIAIVSDPLY